ncbi:MAG TPA: DUF4384 domain-containing protein [Trueperaceae bacterium]
MTKSHPIAMLRCALTLLAFTLLAPLALAQKVVISPQSIVVNPAPSFDVQVTLDRQAGSGDIPSYGIGDSIRIGVSVSDDAYVYLFNVRSSGEVVQILPNRLDQGGDNYVQAGQTVYFPPQGARYTFEIDGPTGLDKVIAVASKEPLDVSQLAQFQSQSDFATSEIGEDSFAQTLSIIVQPLPQAEWVTDTALFYTVAGGQSAASAPEPSFGTLQVSSDPSGATVYVDDQFAGSTPLTYGTTAGTHTVRLELPGYDSFQTQVSISGGQTVNLPVSLQPWSSQAPAAPSGALMGRLQLDLYPGAQVRRLDQGPKQLHLEFETRAELDSVYGHFDQQISARGWQRVDYDVQGPATRIGATYRRNGHTLRLDLDQQGRSGKYRLELELDD